MPAFTRKRDFIKSHLGHVTKCDQYKAMKSFENTVVSIPHASDKGLLTGDRIVRKLRRRLKKVGFFQVGFLLDPFFAEKIAFRRSELVTASL